MLVKLSIILNLINGILFIINDDIILGTISIMLLILTFILIIYTVNYRVRLQSDKYIEIIEQMRNEGASDEKIDYFINNKTKVDEDLLLEDPMWIQIVSKLIIITTIGLFVFNILK